MENISDVSGTAEIEACSYDAIEELKKIFKTTSTWKYNIFCIDLDTKRTLESTVEEIQHGYLPYYIICDFKGSGYESFSATLELFKNWLNKEIIMHNQLLQDSEFKITFKYIDQNPKQNFIIESQRKIIHASKADMVINHYDYEFKYDYTLVNKAMCFGRNLGKVIADELEDKNSSNIVSILYNERREIEKYTGKLLEVYLYENGLGEYAEMYNKFITD